MGDGKASYPLIKSSKNFMSSCCIGAQYGSTNAQNLFGVSFFGVMGLLVSLGGFICSFSNGSKSGLGLADFVSKGFPELSFIFFKEFPSFPPFFLLPGDPGP